MKATMLWAIVLSCAVVGASLPGEEGELAGRMRVADGDTLRLGPRRVRLFGIDAPEIAQVCRVRGIEYRCGIEATKALKALIGEATVRCRRRAMDRYGRVVAVCWAGEVDLGRAMVRSGWAVAYTSYSRIYLREQELARKAKRGLWRGEFEPPADYRHGHPRQ